MKTARKYKFNRPYELESEEMRWLSLALFGQQSEKEIRLMRAGFGMNEETTIDKEQDGSG